ncbi:MAG: antitoxin Xre-like helix-turn-helix domain-containing protein [Polyangiaceae bacterium]
MATYSFTSKMTAAYAQPDQPDPSIVVTKATSRAASMLGLSQKELARILGVSESTASRMASGKHVLDVGKKEGELALLFVRVFRSLDALVGGSEDKARAWLTAENTHVGGIPKERIQNVEGLVHVAQYLDAMRGKI